MPSLAPSRHSNHYGKIRRCRAAMLCRELLHGKDFFAVGFWPDRARARTCLLPRAKRRRPPPALLCPSGQPPSPAPTAHAAAAAGPTRPRSRRCGPSAHAAAAAGPSGQPPSPAPTTGDQPSAAAVLQGGGWGRTREEEGGGEDQEEEGDEEDLSEDEGLGNLVFDPDPSLEWCEPEDYQYVPALERLRPRDRKPYRRGITQLPSLRSWRYRHVVLVPYGRSSFQFEDPTQRPPRGYSNILGGLLRWYFPGIVNFPTGGCDVAWRWAHYSLAEDPLGRGTAADMVVAKFWVRDF
nr:uncharacterized protein LOC127309939 [Lolium perenne]